MKALWYLTATKLKNQLKSLIRKPARLIYVIFMLAMLGLVLWGGSQLEPDGTFRPMEELTAIAFAVYAIMFLLSVNAGFSRGGSLFNLSDVNLVFTAPIRSQAVLFHGLLQGCRRHEVPVGHEIEPVIHITFHGSPPALPASRRPGG